MKKFILINEHMTNILIKERNLLNLIE